MICITGIFQILNFTTFSLNLVLQVYAVTVFIWTDIFQKKLNVFSISLE